jgi:hypothetical protein
MSPSRDRFNGGRRRTLQGLMVVPFLPLAIPTIAANTYKFKSLHFMIYRNLF